MRHSTRPQGRNGFFHPAHPVPLSMAARTPRPEGARGHRPVCLFAAKAATVYVPVLYKHAVDAGPGRARRGRRAAGLDPGLRRGAGAVADLLRTARRHLRPRRPARHPRRRAADLPPPAWAGAALSPGAPDRRAEPRHRTRHQGHPDPCCPSCCSTSCPRSSRSDWSAWCCGACSTAGWRWPPAPRSRCTSPTRCWSPNGEPSSAAR